MRAFKKAGMPTPDEAIVEAKATVERSRRKRRVSKRRNASAPRRKRRGSAWSAPSTSSATAVQDAKRRARERAQAAAPYVVGGVGLIAVLKVLRRKR